MICTYSYNNCNAVISLCLSRLILGPPYIFVVPHVVAVAAVDPDDQAYRFSSCCGCCCRFSSCCCCRGTRWSSVPIVIHWTPVVAVAFVFLMLLLLLLSCIRMTKGTKCDSLSSRYWCCYRCPSCCYCWCRWSLCCCSCCCCCCRFF